MFYAAFSASMFSAPFSAPMFYAVTRQQFFFFEVLSGLRLLVRLQTLRRVYISPRLHLQILNYNHFTCGQRRNYFSPSKHSTLIFASHFSFFFATRKLISFFFFRPAKIIFLHSYSLGFAPRTSTSCFPFFWARLVVHKQNFVDTALRSPTSRC